MTRYYLQSGSSEWNSGKARKRKTQRITRVGRDRCNVCLRLGTIRCSCTWENEHGSHRSPLCRRCWDFHICMTLWIQVRIWVARRIGLMCPFRGIPYKRLPGYLSGFGCPVCGSTGDLHIRLEKKPSSVRYK